MVSPRSLPPLGGGLAPSDEHSSITGERASCARFIGGVGGMPDCMRLVEQCRRELSRCVAIVIKTASGPHPLTAIYGGWAVGLRSSAARLACT